MKIRKLLAHVLLVGTCISFASTSYAQSTEKIKLEPGYRVGIARLVLFNYRKYGLGPARISEELKGNSLDICHEYPIKRMSWIGEATTGTQLRSFRSQVVRDSKSGKLKATLDQSNFTPCEGPMKP